jgi:hypothetical protein
MVGFPLLTRVGMLLYIALNPGTFSFSQTREWMATTNCENFIYISGESNVNQFSFRYKKAYLQSRYNSSSRDSENIEISIPIKDFEASNPMMYSDFLALMKESDYPRIKVAFSKRQLQCSKDNLSATCPDIRITIAGITRIYKIQCAVFKCSDNLYLSGEETIKLSDFQLKPPVKMLGLVKVNNEIDVNFGFIITFTDDNQLSATL